MVKPGRNVGERGKQARAAVRHDQQAKKFEAHHAHVAIDPALSAKVEALSKKPEFAWASKKWPRILEQAMVLRELPAYELVRRFEIMRVESRKLVVNLLPEEKIWALVEKYPDVIEWVVV